MDLSECPEGVPYEVHLKRYPASDSTFIRFHKGGLVFEAGKLYYGVRRGSLTDGYVVVKKLFREDGDD